MTVQEIIEMFIDENCQEFTIYDNEKGEEVFTGYLDEIPEEYEEAEVTSIDNLTSYSDIIALNVDTPIPMF